MTCCNVSDRFRLLDGLVGWDPIVSLSKHVRYDEYGLRLDNRDEPQLSSDLISPFMPPARLAFGYGPGKFYLCGTNADANESEALLLFHDPCYEHWIDLRKRFAEGLSLVRPLAVAVTKRRLAVVDETKPHQHRMLIWSIPDGRLAGLTILNTNDRPTAIAFSSWCEVLVAVERTDSASQVSHWLLRYDYVGQYRGEIEVAAAVMKPKHPLTRLRTAHDGSLWAAEGNDLGSFHLWRIAPTQPSVNHVCDAQPEFSVERLTDVEFYQQAEEKLSENFRPTALVSLGANHFCIKTPNASCEATKKCFSLNGELLAQEPHQTALDAQSKGVLYTEPLDSFIPRCRWHRIRINADVPPNTSYMIDVATSEEVNALPHDDDWQLAAQNADDLLIDQPPGRYLFVRLTLTGTLSTTPVIHRVRIDFPRVTSLEQLPAVYRDNPEAEDFTERFLSLFDAATQDLDEAIARFPALLNPEGVPNEVLNWLGALLGIVFDADWDSELRRKLLKAAPSLYQKRGTIEGLKQAIKLIFFDGEPEDAYPYIDESASHRAWGIINQNARLGTVRLFGKSESRFRVGRSALGAAPLRSFGNPDHDAVRVEAHRFVVLMPPTQALRKYGAERLNQLIEHQKPAHTQHQLRVGGQGFIVGVKSVVGVDTQFVAPQPVVLQQVENGQGNIRLGNGVLRSGPNRPTSSLHLSVSSAIGIQTLLE